MCEDKINKINAYYEFWCPTVVVVLCLGVFLPERKQNKIMRKH